MRRMSRITLLVASAGLFASVQAADWMYTRASVGFAAADLNGSDAQKIKDNYDWDVAVGKKVQDWRFEGAVGYLKVKKDAGAGPDAAAVDSQVMTYMANAYYDLPIGGNKDLVPHIGIGLGAADYTSDFTRFAMSGNVGLNYRLDRNMWVNANYRYLEAQKSKANEKYKANTFNLGLAYAFS